MDFGSQVGAKLGGKIEPRQAKTGQDKGRQGKRREGKGKEEEGKGLEGKGVEKCGWGLLSGGGGGVHPTFRGRLHWTSPSRLFCGTENLITQDRTRLHEDSQDSQAEGEHDSIAGD